MTGTTFYQNKRVGTLFLSSQYECMSYTFNWTKTGLQYQFGTLNHVRLLRRALFRVPNWPSGALDLELRSGTEGLS